MIYSDTSYSNNLVDNNKKSSMVPIYGIILLIVIIFIYFIIVNCTYEKKETLIFYLNKKCPYSKKILPLINNCKKQKKVNIVIIYDYEMNKKEKRMIKEFPTAIRHSDKKMAVGENDIKKLIKQTLLLSNIEFFDNMKKNKKDIIFYLDYSSMNISSIINKYNNQSKYNLIIKYNDNLNDSDVDLSGNKINYFPVAVIKSENKIYYGDNNILLLLEKILDIIIINETVDNNSKDTIQFYIAEWCKYSQKILPYIEKYKMQNIVNVEIIYDNNIPKELNITGYPTAIRKSDNKRGVGETEILNLMKETFEKNNKQNVQKDEDENTIIVFLAEWCGFCQKFKPQLDELMKKNNNIKIVDSKDITPEFQEYIKGFPTAIKVSDKTPAVGAPEILKMIKEQEVKQEVKQEVRQEVKQDNQQEKITIIVFLAEWCGFCQKFKPQLIEIMKTNTNIKIVDSNNIPPEYKQYVDGFPTAIKISDKTGIIGKPASGAPEILKMIHGHSNGKKQEIILDNNNNNNINDSLIIVYSNNCKYSNLVMPEWQKFKLNIVNNNNYKNNIRLVEYESSGMDKLPDNYKSQLAGFPTLFYTTNNIISQKFEGYDEIINYLTK
jgi:thiol-disulfide isomerase/thioredoxin